MSRPASASLLWLGIVAFAGAIAAAAVVSCSGDDIPESRPEPPPFNVDAASEAGTTDAGGESCPEGEPKVGDLCRTASAEEMCTYQTNTCTVNGQAYDKFDSYRCFEGVWIKWPQPEKSPCDE
jgi:hypothetical protein